MKKKLKKLDKAADKARVRVSLYTDEKRAELVIDARKLMAFKPFQPFYNRIDGSIEVHWKDEPTWSEHLPYITVYRSLATDEVIGIRLTSVRCLPAQQKAHQPK